MSTVSKKICLVGDFGVGKTSLIRRFVDRQFSDKYLSTVGVKISRKSVEVSTTEFQTDKQVQLLIWDIEGSNKFKAISSSYFQGARGAIIVADVTRQETLENVQEHIQSFSRVNPQSNIIIALNKSDLIETEYLEEFKKKYQYNDNTCVLATYITSAKTGNNVDDIFTVLANSFFQ
ncbi:MAG: Rab family GTPase [Cyanobacteria bacterium P01_A01_bin.84]